MKIIGRRRNYTYILLVLTSIIAAFFAFKLIFNSRAKRGEKYNVIIIAMNDLAANHVSGLGYKRKTTPNLDKLASKSYVFENAFAQSSWTLPSAISIFTSEYPYTHKIMNRVDVLPKKIRTLAEILRLYNYCTAAFTGGGDYHPGTGLGRGFNRFYMGGSFTSFRDSIKEAKKWLALNQEKPFFLYLQGYDIHPPFNPPPPYDSMFFKDPNYKPKFDRNKVLRAFKQNRESSKLKVYYHRKMKKSPIIYLNSKDIEYLKAQYDGKIAYADTLIGGFLDGLSDNLKKKTIIIILSEHGEMFGKNGRFGRAGPVRGTFYDDVLRVPLIIKTPWENKPKKIKQLVQLVDIAPTLLKWINIPQPLQFQGKSLLGLIQDNKAVNPYVYAASKFGRVSGDMTNPLYNVISSSEMIRSLRWKLIREVDKKKNSESLELYNLVKDPDEQVNLASKKIAVTKKLKQRLLKWIKSTKSSFKTKKKKIPKELEEEAKKHGYW